MAGVRDADEDALDGADEHADDEADAGGVAAQTHLLLGERVLVAAGGAAAQWVAGAYHSGAARRRQVAGEAVVDPVLIDHQAGADRDVALDLPGGGEGLGEADEGLPALVEARP